MGEGYLFVSLLVFYWVNKNPEVGEVVEARILGIRIDVWELMFG